MLAAAKKRIFSKDSDLIVGISKANNLPLVSQGVANFNNKLIVRIFRFIGGLAFLSTLLNKSVTAGGESSIFTGLPTFIILTISVVALVYSIYFIVMIMIKNYYILYHLKHKNYEVRNSPIKPIASMIGKSYLCFKGVCQNVGIAGGLFGAFYTVDAILVDTHREPIFKPLISVHFSKILTTCGWCETKTDINPLTNSSVKSAK